MANHHSGKPDEGRCHCSGSKITSGIGSPTTSCCDGLVIRTATKVALSCFFHFHRRTADRVGSELVGLSLCCLLMLADEGPKGLQTPNSPSDKSIDNLQHKIGSGTGSSRTQAFCGSLWMLGRGSLNLLLPVLQVGESNHSAQCHIFFVVKGRTSAGQESTK
jgi:hypothetical protein